MVQNAKRTTFEPLAYSNNNSIGISKMWSFNRLRDASKIVTEEIEWRGPFSWLGFESDNELPEIPDVEGVYLFTFKFKDGFLLYGVGITNSTRIRIATHNREFRKGNYTVLDVQAAENGERKEIWHGWQYAKDHRSEFEINKDLILKAVEQHLKACRIYISEVSDKRKRERIEAAIMHNIYASKEPWSELSDRGMHLKERCNSEMPIKTINRSLDKIYGLSEILEI